MQCYRTKSLITAVLLAVSASESLGQHEGDLLVGVNAEHQLALSTNGFVPGQNFVSLEPVNGLIQGWSHDEPGFDHVVAPADLQPLADGASLWLEVVAVDPAFQVIDDGFQILRYPGEDTMLGGADLHAHVTWHINNQDPSFDPQQCVWHAMFVLRDDGGTQYESSAPIAFSFTNVPVRTDEVAAAGDFDTDGSIDAADHTALAACLFGGGPARLPNPAEPGVTTCSVECLNAFDFDDDRDVDLRDAASYQQATP